MVDSEGEFEAAAGEWKATGAESMPGLGEESGEPMPDMGEEVDESTENPSGEVEEVDGTPETEKPAIISNHAGMSDVEESKESEEIEKMLGNVEDADDVIVDYTPDNSYAETEVVAGDQATPELAAGKYLGGDMGLYWMVSIMVFLAAFILYRRATRNKKPAKEGKISLI